jgi:hypothetical protein
MKYCKYREKYSAIYKYPGRKLEGFLFTSVSQSFTGDGVEALAEVLLRPELIDILPFLRTGKWFLGRGIYGDIFFVQGCWFWS